MKKLLLFLLLLVTAWSVRGQGIFSLEVLPVCWTISGTDSTLYAYWQLSSRDDEPKVKSYLNAQGQEVNVSAGGTFTPGYCNMPTASTYLDSLAVLEDSIIVLYAQDGTEIARDTVGPFGGGDGTIVLASNGLNDQDPSSEVDVELGGTLERPTVVDGDNSTYPMEFRQVQHFYVTSYQATDSSGIYLLPRDLVMSIRQGNDIQRIDMGTAGGNPGRISIVNVSGSKSASIVTDRPEQISIGISDLTDNVDVGIVASQVDTLGKLLLNTDRAGTSGLVDAGQVPIAQDSTGWVEFGYPQMLGDSSALAFIIDDSTNQIIVGQNGATYNLPYRDPDATGQGPGEFIPVVDELGAPAGNGGWLNVNSLKFENVRSLNIATPLLDEHPIRRRGGMFFSVYRVNSNYRGPAFDMRNSEGDTASIPYLSNGYIDADSIASFANGNVSHLVTWYDQSLNGYHAYAVDISTAPELTDSSGILHVNAEGVFGPNFSFGDYLEGNHRMKGNEASLFFVGQEYASGSSTSVAWFSADIANVNSGVMFGASWTVGASIGLLDGTDNQVITRSHNFQQDTTVFHLMTNTPTLKNWFVGGQMQELDTIALSYSDAIDWGTRFNIGIAYSGASSLYRQYTGVINEVGVFNYDLAKNASDLAGNVNSRFSIEASNLEYVIDTVITLPSILEKEFVVQSPRGTTNLTFTHSAGIYCEGGLKDTVRFNHVTAEYIRFRVDTIGGIVTWNLLEGPATQESPASFNDIVIHEGVLNFDEIPEHLANGKTQGELLQEVVQHLGDTERGNVIYLSDLYLGKNDTTIILTDNIVISSTYQGAPTQDDQKANITLDFNDPNMDGFFIIPDTVNNLVEPRGASFKNLRFEVLSPMRKVIDMGNTIGSIVSDCEMYLNDNAGVGIRMGAENWPGSADPLSPLSNRIDRVRIFDATDAAALVQGGTLNYFTETQLHRSATGIRVEGGTVYMNECWVEKSEGLALDIEQARIFSFQNGYLENQNTAAVDTVAMRLNNTDIFIFSGNTYSSAGTTMDAVFELEDVKHFEYSNNWISGAGVSNEIIDRSPEITCLNKFGNDYFSPGFTPVEPTICEPDLVDATLTRPVSNDATITNVDLKGTLNFTNIQLDGFKNLVANSEDVQTSSPSYTISATRLAVLVNDRANPLSGEITAERLTLTASTSAKLIEIFTSEPMVVGDRYNLTFYYEPGTEAFNDNITIEQNTFSNPEDFNLDSGLKQFQKISYTFTATNTASIQLRVRGDTDDYFWLTNVQITAGESSRDYVQTTGVSVKSNPKLTVDSEVSLLIDGDFQRTDRAEGNEDTTTDGTGDVTITHSLGFTPTNINITPLGTGGSPLLPQVLSNTINSTTFTVRWFTPSTGLAATSAAVNFHWSAE